MHTQQKTGDAMHDAVPLTEARMIWLMAGEDDPETACEPVPEMGRYLVAWTRLEQRILTPFRNRGVAMAAATALADIFAKAVNVFEECLTPTGKVHVRMLASVLGR